LRNASNWFAKMIFTLKSKGLWKEWYASLWMS